MVSKHYHWFRIIWFFIFIDELQHDCSLQSLILFFNRQMVEVAFSQPTQVIVPRCQIGELGAQHFSFLLDIDRSLSLFKKLLPALERLVRIQKLIIGLKHLAAALIVILHC